MGSDEKKKKAKSAPKTDEKARSRAKEEKKPKSKSKVDSSVREKSDKDKKKNSKKPAKSDKKASKKKEKLEKKPTKVKKEKKEKKDKKQKKEKKDKKKKKEQKSKKPSKRDLSSKKNSKKPCVICKDDNIDADVVGSSCDHNFCVPCIEILLSKPIPGEPKAQDNHLGAPTMGRCPECSAELKKFETRNKKGKHYFDRNTDRASWPIDGLAFCQKESEDGHKLGDFHFDVADSLPFMNFTDAIALDEKKEKWILSNYERVPEKAYFEEGCHYDEKTRTFHGTILWKEARFDGSYRWDVVLGFSRDFSSIRVGLIHKRKERLGVAASAKDKQILECPLDGTWKLSWKGPDGKKQKGNVTVRNNQFHQGPFTFSLDLDDPENPGFKWPLDPVEAKAKSGLNLADKPKGPAVGKKIIWTTTHPSFPEMTWERETIAEKHVASTEHIGTPPFEYIVTSGEKAKLAASIHSGDDSEDDGSDSEESSKGWDDEESVSTSSSSSSGDSESESSSTSGSSDSDSDSSSS